MGLQDYKTTISKGNMLFDRVWLTPKPSVLSEIQWMDSVEMEILEAYLDPTGAFQMELAKIKFNAQRAIDELSSKMWFLQFSCVPLRLDALASALYTAHHLCRALQVTVQVTSKQFSISYTFQFLNKVHFVHMLIVSVGWLPVQTSVHRCDITQR